MKEQIEKTLRIWAPYQVREAGGKGLWRPRGPEAVAASLQIDGQERNYGDRLAKIGDPDAKLD